MSNVSVLGAGGWGTALSIILANKNHNVTLWGRDKEKCEKMSHIRENSVHLPNIKLPDNLIITSDIQKNLKIAEYIIFAVPAQHLRKIVDQLRFFIPEKVIIVNVSKGIENATYERMSQVLQNELPGKHHNNIVVLSGPSHAEEVAKNKYTTVVAAGYDVEKAKLVQELFASDFFKVFIEEDIVGVELGGALKNCLGIASGIMDGMGYGDNIKSTILVSGFNEMVKLGVKLGALEKTFFGISGLGDALATCKSLHSRNRFFGEMIGKGRKKNEILKETSAIIEGLATLKSVHDIAQKIDVNIPLFETVYDIVYNEKNSDILIKKFMSN